MLKADLHIHTIASGHGYATITENMIAAHAKGLEMIAITDHGPHVPQGAHPWYFWNLKMTPSLYKGMRVLHGCEANIVDDHSENGLDLPDALLEVLDYVQVGMHLFCGFDAGDRGKNTEGVLRALENPFVDQLNHPGNDQNFPLDLDQVIAAAKRNNVIIEFNAHSFDEHGSRGGSHEVEIAFAQAAFASGVPIAIGSDAHYFDAIGVFDAPLEAAAQVGIPEEYFLNRDAQTVLEHIKAKRARPRIDWGPVIQ